MKKVIVVLITFLLVFISCDDLEEDNESNNNTTLQISNQSSKELDQVVFQSVLFMKENADVIGTWKGVSSTRQLTLNINENSWAGSEASSTSLTIITTTSQGSWTRNGNTLVFQGKNWQYATATISENILTVNLDFPSGMYSCTSDNLQKSIKFGTSVTKQIAAGGGYIFFKVNSVDYYTNEFVVIEANEKAVFSFTNNTLVVEVNNPSEPIKLGDI